MRISNRLSAVELSDWTGEPQNLAVFWQDRPIVLVFIRHFG
jgi:hypothetical protein